MWQAYNAYDPKMGISFDGFLRSCLQKKFKSELTHRHRQKRVLNQLAVSLDATGDGGDLLIDGYKANEIQRILGMSAREYSENLQIMRSYERVKILF